MIDEETCQMRAQELGPRTSSSRPNSIGRSIIKGAEIVVGTIEVDPTNEIAGSMKPNPPAC